MKKPWLGNPLDVWSGGWWPISAVVGNTCAINPPGIKEAEQNLIYSSRGTDLMFLIDAYLLVSSGVIKVTPENHGQWKLNLKNHPNHWVVLLEEVTDDGTSAHFGVWTWGATHTGLTAPIADFSQYYYGTLSPLALV